MKNEGRQREGIRLIFSVISVMLMLPLLATPQDANLYRTVFIYQMGITLDSILETEKGNFMFLNIVDIFNRILSIFTCAYAFCCILDIFRNMVGGCITFLNTIMMISVCSCLIHTILCYVCEIIRVRFVKEDIIKNSEEDIF